MHNMDFAWATAVIVLPVVLTSAFVAVRYAVRKYTVDKAMKKALV